MEVLSSAQIDSNAYRVLGLSGGASQGEIDVAARRMRIWSDPSQIPPTPWDLSWMGPIDRTRNQIEQAVSRLNDPIVRIDQRLFWFAESSAAQKPGAKGIAPSAPTGPTYDHDLAVARFCAMLRDDPQAMREAEWGKALADLISVTRSDSYRTWFLAIEQNGDFEKRGLTVEFDDAVAALPFSIANALAARARDAIDLGKYPVSLRYARLLRVVAPDPVSFEPYEKSICDRVEDLLMAHTRRLTNQIFHEINWEKKDWQRYSKFNLNICKKAAGEIKETVEPLIGILEVMSGADSDRLRRIGASTAHMYRNMGLAWQRARKMRAADRALKSGRRFAKSTPHEAKIEEDICDLANRRKFSRRFLGIGKPKQTNKESSGKSLAWIAAVILYGVVHGLSLWNSPSSNKSLDETPLHIIQEPPPQAPLFSPEMNLLLGNRGNRPATTESSGGDKPPVEGYGASSARSANQVPPDLEPVQH